MDQIGERAARPNPSSGGTLPWLWPDGRATAKTTLATAIIATGIYAGFLWIGTLAGHAPDVIVRDPAASYRFWPFAGILSHLGVFLMIATSAICLFASLVTRTGARMLLAIGLFSGYFAMDDFFMLHEAFFPRRGVPETAVLGALAGSAALIMIAFRDHFLNRKAIAIWASALVLVSSSGVDVFATYSLLHLVAEDGLKFVGISLWALHWILVARATLRDEIRSGHLRA